MTESAIIVRVSEAGSFVAGLRQRCDPSAAIGVPAHITILYPFMPPACIDPEVLTLIRTVVRPMQPFSFHLGNVGRWPETTYLSPQPADPFIKLTRVLTRAFPDYPPYGGKYSSIVPHLTVADRSAELAAECEAKLHAMFLERGPISSTCREIELLENSSGTWRLMHAIKLEVCDG